MEVDLVKEYQGWLTLVSMPPPALVERVERVERCRPALWRA